MSKKITKETPEQKARRLTKENKGLLEIITREENRSEAQVNKIYNLGNETRKLEDRITGLEKNIEILESSKEVFERENIGLEAALKERKKQFDDFQVWTANLLRDIASDQ